MYLAKRILVLLLVIVASCNPPKEVPTQPEKKAVKNIIFMVGDGMGLTQATAGLVANDFKLNLERVQYVGLSKTFSSDALITDSAAGATAFSVGEKTYNGAIGVMPDSTSRETILETAGAKGLATGLVVVCTITHATPGSFYAHQPSRNMHEEIASDMIDSPVNYFVGGGRKYFAARKDSTSILPALEEKGFSFVESLEAFKSSTSEKIGYFIADGEPAPVAEGRGPILSEAVEAMLPKLANDPEGFFLVVEGSQIDWGGHNNNSEYITSEMIDFDNAIGKVLDFAAKDGNTLVVITADHETGGYSLTEAEDPWKFEPKFTTGHHTATMVPVYAFGAGSEAFAGIYHNTEIYHKMMKAYGWK
ncbi:MAG: alkaline phosphatase [Imperialibacter sp.]|uniref:alkaline phosphatase n=1 Tax=Imperialibacter sp. TaxID=2038411 RepID=UPI0032EDCBE6